MTSTTQRPDSGLSPYAEVTISLPDDVARALQQESGLSFVTPESFVLSALVRELRRRDYGLGKMTAREKRWRGLEDVC